MQDDAPQLKHNTDTEGVAPSQAVATLRGSISEPTVVIALATAASYLVGSSYLATYYEVFGLRSGDLELPIEAHLAAAGIPFLLLGLWALLAFTPPPLRLPSIPLTPMPDRDSLARMSDEQLTTLLPRISESMGNTRRKLTRRVAALLVALVIVATGALYLFRKEMSHLVTTTISFCLVGLTGLVWKRNSARPLYRVGATSVLVFIALLFVAFSTAKSSAKRVLEGERRIDLTLRNPIDGHTQLTAIPIVHVGSKWYVALEDRAATLLIPDDEIVSCKIRLK